MSFFSLTSFNKGVAFANSASEDVIPVLAEITLIDRNANKIWVFIKCTGDSGKS